MMATMPDMTILLPTLAVAYAAFCIWLTVRIVNRRERSVKWTLVARVVGPPVLYVLSFGPACWLAAQIEPIEGEPNTLAVLATVYRPVISLTRSESNPASSMTMQYARLLPKGRFGRLRMATFLKLEYWPPNSLPRRTGIVIEPRFDDSW
jgi:hypothetical protein